MNRPTTNHADRRSPSSADRRVHVGDRRAPEHRQQSARPQSLWSRIREDFSLALRGPEFYDSIARR